ncbi:MAG: ribbon-helix-helix protein, CopG family [Sphingobacteriales bacterium]|nr:ribbon-helix-helix protein, CopG family [Sphingobacteriales bacterium]
MTAKLTLSIDAKIIEKAKRKAKKEGKSLSAMVEDYLAFSRTG